jgi:ribosomal protein S18 acetylase RimI-like enzyme
MVNLFYKRDFLTQIVMKKLLYSRPWYTFHFLVTFYLALTSCSIQSIHCTFVHKVMDAGWITADYAIECFSDTRRIGFLWYTKLPIVHYYVLYNFYISPEYRNKGHGSALLAYSCDYLAQQGASRVYIQPGPFEMNSAGELIGNSVDYELRLQRLVSFYQKHDFVLVSPMQSFGIGLLYRVLRINENARYLMVRMMKR